MRKQVEDAMHEDVAAQRVRQTVERSADTVKAMALRIEEHQALYDAGKPKLSDAEFDSLVERLRAVAPKHKVLEALGTATTARKLNHVYPMLSLEKAKSAAAVVAWASKIGGEFMLSPKYDGLALSLTYRQGALLSAVTRGDGAAGDDVLHNAKHCPSIPSYLRAPYPPLLTVRGEALFPRTAEAGKQFANLRNGAAGTMLRKTPDKAALSSLEFVAYDVLLNDTPVIRTLEDAMIFADRWGFNTGEQHLVAAEHVEALLEETEERWSSEEHAYECDGAVLKVNKLSAREKLGATAHHPRWAIAYKYAVALQTTKITDVIWQVSRYGALTPVAVVEPVKLSGATVTRATLHNLDQIKRLDEKGRLVGATVRMCRRGGVIPHVESVIEPGRHALQHPRACPDCGEPVVFIDAGYVCSESQECEGTQRAVMHHWCASLDMLGWGEEVLRALWKSGIRQRYQLYECDDELMRIGKTIGKKLAKERDKKALELTPAQFLTALGVRGVGKTQAASVLLKVRGFDELLALCSSEDFEELRKRYTPALAVNLMNGLSSQLFDIEQLLQFVKLKEREAITGPLQGKVIVFTGRMPDLDREEARALVRELGGEATDSVTMRTTHLVVGSLAVEEQRTKRDKAEKYAAKGAPIQIIDEDAFHVLIAEARGEP